MAKPAFNRDTILEKGVPSNVEAERLILGAILFDNTTINQAIERLKTDDFLLTSNHRIFKKMIKLSEQGRGIDPITLQEELCRAGELDPVGVPAYIRPTRLSGSPHWTRASGSM